MKNFHAVRQKLQQVAVHEEKKRRRQQLGSLIALLRALERRELDPEPFSEFLQSIDQLLDEEAGVTKISRIHERIKSYVEKEYKLVVPGHYQTQWMALGMSVFGIPFGLVFALALDNFAFFAIGLPIGMSIGIAVGSSYDNKAREEGRVLELFGDEESEGP